MRLALLLATIPLAAADLKVDHASVCGQDLKTMQAKLTTLGIPSEYGGPHNNHATEMALTSFLDGSYLELITIQPQADSKAVAAHVWSRHLQGNAGPCAWAARPADISAEVKRLEAAGVAVTARERAGRNRPDGVRLDWETANIGTQPRGTYFPFLIQDFTPREARAYPQGKPTTTKFTGISRVVIAVKNLKSAVDDYRKTFGLSAPMEQTDRSLSARLAIFPGTPVVLAEPDSPKSWLTSRLMQFGEGPCAFVLHGTPSASDRYNPTWFDAEKLAWRLGVE